MKKAKSNDETVLVNGLNIVKRHLEGKIPFSIERVHYSDEIDRAVAVLKIGDRRFDAYNLNNEIFINKFPVKNFEHGKIHGYIGFPTDAAGAIFKYYNEKEKTPFEDLRLPGDMKTLGLNELKNLVKEELGKIIPEDFDYSAEELAAAGKEDVAQEEGTREAMISSALSFMQDVQGSANKLVDQKSLMSTNGEVDQHLGEAILHINQAIEIYFNNIDPSIKDDVVRRLGEIKIEENYPAGAATDPRAPWNQVDNMRSGQVAETILYKLVWTDNSEFAIFKDAHGNKYLFYLGAVDKSDFEPYADVDNGDWNIEDYVIENYVNDNLNHIQIGKGIEDYENGFDLVAIDDELRNELIGLTKYFKDDKTRIDFLGAIDAQISESGTDKIITKKTMDTPTGTLFVIDFGKLSE